MGGVTMVAVLLVAVMAVAACGGGATEAQQQLDGALNEYQTALEKVDQLDLENAAKSKVESAREDLAAKWSDVQKWSEEAGSQAATELKSGYEQLSSELGKAADGAKANMAEAEQAVDQALTNVRSKLDQVWTKLKDLF
jgi:DNA repair exonuclease SbcCD ATPase subunit